MKIEPIPYGRQNITDEDINAVITALKSDFLTQGPKIFEFENKFAKYIGAKYAVAVANGTAALHLCTLALGIKPGNKVITTPITFSASANCIRYSDGEVIFSDIDPNTFLLDINKLQELIDKSPQGTYSGIIPVDFAGRSVDLEAIKRIADKNNLWIIEDACHAPGGFFIDSKNNKQNCGNGYYADLSIFSFHPVKHIACGEGGMITTNNEKLYEKLLELRTHGITRKKENFINTIGLASGDEATFDYPEWYMEMQSLGFNYRLTDFQAALGISQLDRADQGLARRKEIAETYDKAFKNKPYIIQQSGVVDGHAYHLYIIEVKNRLGLYNYLRKNSIYAQIHYIPVHLMPYYQSFGWKQGDMPNAELFYRNCISLPMYPTLKNEELNYVIDKIDNFYNG
ncbi:MAG: UDP-4-amino-4,6-dideoxy-N-acetyl-beta-L-altrosamine transaminase [Dysgonomonas sp.]